MNMKLKLQVWTDQDRGLNILVFNILLNILAFFNPFKDSNLLSSLMIGDMIEAKFLMKHL
jgi:hypothetical protein